MGQSEAALEVTREAVDIRRTALEAAREAVNTYRTLTKGRPDAFLPDLAASLQNLGMHLSDAGDYEASLEATREAVDTYRALTKAPGPYCRSLAGVHVAENPSVFCYFGLLI